MRARMLVAGAAVAVGLIGGAEDSAATRPAPAVAEGGRNLKWCLLGIRIWAQGVAADQDLLELGGGLIAYVNCR